MPIYNYYVKKIIRLDPVRIYLRNAKVEACAKKINHHWNTAFIQ